MCDNMDESGRHHVKCNKLGMERHVLMISLSKSMNVSLRSRE
jgi:hypothetical protein